MSTLTAEAKHLILLPASLLLKLQGEDGETQILLTVIFLDFQKRFDGKHRYHWQQWFWIVKQVFEHDYSHLSGCLWRVIPLLQEQHGVWGGEDIFPRIHPAMPLLLVLHPQQQPWPDDL